MKKYLVCISCTLMLVSIAFAQTRSKTAAKQTVSELKKVLTGSSLPFQVINDSLALVPFEGDNIAAYKVIIQRISDLYIVYTNLTEALPGKIDETKYKYLLQQNDQYDVVKIGMSAGEGIFYLRADLYKSGVNTALLTRVIKQVANVANIIGGDLK